jgi:nucleoside-diphosphate-sugar epimerase
VKVLVAGARSAVGRRLVPLLLEQGHDVVGVSRSGDGVRELTKQGVRGVEGDLLDQPGMMRLLHAERPEIVVHEVSGIPRVLDPGKTRPQFADSVLIRTVGTHNLVDAARASGARRVIAQSYAHIYAPLGGWVKQESDPLNLGADVPEGRLRNVQSIVALEKAVLDTPGIEGVALRYGALYGPGTAYDRDGSVARLVRQRHYPLVGGGTGWTSFLHIDDAAAAVVLAIDGPTGAFNIVDDRPAPLTEWLPAFARALDAPPPRHTPSFVVRALGREHFAYRSTEQRAADNRWARAHLGFVPGYLSWREGFHRELEHEMDFELGAAA